MTKKKAAPKKAKEKRSNPPQAPPMAGHFDEAMSKIAKAPWPPPKDTDHSC